MIHQHFNILSRRSFLSTTVKAGVTAAFASLVDIPGVMKRALAEGTIGLNGKKVLFIWLRGANDALNSVIPAGDDRYAPSRPTLAVPTGIGWQNTGGTADYFESGAGPTYGNADAASGALQPALGLGNGFAALHPSLKFLAPVYNAGDLALVHRVAYPKQSRSHFDSQNYWETGSPNNNFIKDGIFYRAIFESGLANTAPLTGVSVQSSLPLILRGSAAAMTNLTDPTRYDLLGIPTAGDAKATNALARANTFPFTPKQSRELLQLQYRNLENTLGVFAQIHFGEDPDPADPIARPGNYYRDDEVTDGDTAWANANGGQGYYLFPTTNVKNGGWRRPDGTDAANKYVVDPAQQNFFNNLKAAALVLNKTDAIIAGTEFGGFDTHQNQGRLTGQHPNLNRAIGWSMYALRKYFTRYADKVDWNNIVVVTLSEFGRTSIENSDNGTDHAEAGLMFMGGGGVNGGVYNCKANGEPLPWQPGTGGSMFGVNGRYLQRNTDFRSVLGEIIRDHLGATQSQLNRIIPGYASTGERLQSGGQSSIDGVQIRGELGIV